MFLARSYILCMPLTTRHAVPLPAHAHVSARGFRRPRAASRTTPTTSSALLPKVRTTPPASSSSGRTTPSALVRTLSHPSANLLALNKLPLLSSPFLSLSVIDVTVLQTNGLVPHSPFGPSSFLTRCERACRLPSGTSSARTAPSPRPSSPEGRTLDVDVLHGRTFRTSPIIL